MKRFVSAIVALMLLMCSFAVAESGESYPVGPYAFASDGSFSITVNNENDIVISTTDGQYYANLMYQLFSDFGLTPELFEQVGITNHHEIGNMVVDSVFSSSDSMLAERSREDAYLGELAVIYYDATMTSDSTPVCGALIVTDEGALSILTKAMSAECTPESSRAIVDSIIGFLTLNGASLTTQPAQSSEGNISIGGSLSNMSGLLSGNVGGSDSESAAETPATGEVITLSSYSLATPEGWEVFQATDLQVIYSYGNTMITVGVTSTGGEALFSMLDSEQYAEMLETSTYSGLDIAGFDADALAYEQMNAADGTLYIHFTGSAPLGDGMNVTGASFIMGDDMALIMVFHPTGTTDDMDAILNQGLAMFFN